MAETLVCDEFEHSYTNTNDGDSNLDEADKADIRGNELAEKKVSNFMF
jgi:hypothetical protein